MGSQLIEVHVIFKGKVQGVGFRATVRHLALQLGVTGTVRNKADGTVEMYAQADKTVLEKLLQNIQATFDDYIHESAVHYSNATRSFDGFQIGM